jgi:hypothetical protein
VQRTFFAAGIGLAPLTLTLYNVLSPFLRGNGQAAIAANLAADPVTNGLHLAFGFATGLLLPIGFLGMALLAMGRSPWLATLGGMLGLVGWMPWSALMAREALTLDMAQLGGGPQFAALGDRFNSDGAMTFSLVLHIIAHLVSAVPLGIALWRARAVPVWSAWALVLTSPLTMVGILARSLRLLYFVCALFIIGMLPAALAMLMGGQTLACDDR